MAMIVRQRDQHIERHRPLFAESQEPAERLFDDLLDFGNHRPGEDGVP